MEQMHFENTSTTDRVTGGVGGRRRCRALLLVRARLVDKVAADAYEFGER